MRALAILGKDFGFEIPPDMIGDLVDDLGHVNPIMTKSMLDGFATFIAGLDDKLDKESLTGVDYGRPNITRLSPSSKHPTEPDK